MKNFSGFTLNFLKFIQTINNMINFVVHFQLLYQRKTFLLIMILKNIYV